MSEQDVFQITQGLTVLPPRSGKAYPIPCEEWRLLKDKITKYSSEPWFFHTIGSILVGAGISTLTTIFLGAFSASNQERTNLIAWGVVATTSLSGLLCLIFAHQERQSKREHATDVLAQMGLIEQRYEPPSP